MSSRFQRHLVQLLSPIVIAGCVGSAAKPSAQLAATSPPATSSSPESSASEPSAPEPSASESEPNAPAATPLGRFEPVVVIQQVESEEVMCTPLLNAIDVLPDGTAWLAGGCGLRLRVTPEGEVEDLRVPPVERSFEIGGTAGECHATATFWDLHALSDNDVYALSDLRCGMDPNTLWYRELDHFDGSNWRALETKVPSTDPHHGTPDRFLKGATQLFALVRGDDWHGFPHCDVFRYAPGTWGEGLRPCRHPSTEDTSHEIYNAGAAQADGTLWIVGAVDAAGKRGAVWVRREGVWSQQLLDDTELNAISITASDSVWVGGKALWHLTNGQFVKHTEEDYPIVSLWAESADQDRVWVLRAEPRLFEGSQERMVEFERDSFTSPRALAGAGKHLWMVGGGTAWKLVREGPGPAPTRVPSLLAD